MFLSPVQCGPESNHTTCIKLSKNIDIIYRYIWGDLQRKPNNSLELEIWFAIFFCGNQEQLETVIRYLFRFWLSLLWQLNQYIRTVSCCCSVLGNILAILSCWNKTIRPQTDWATIIACKRDSTEKLSNRKTARNTKCVKYWGS